MCRDWVDITFSVWGTAGGSFLARLHMSAKNSPCQTPPLGPYSQTLKLVVLWYTHTL